MGKLLLAAFYFGNEACSSVAAGRKRRYGLYMVGRIKEPFVGLLQLFRGDGRKRERENKGTAGAGISGNSLCGLRKAKNKR